MTTTDHARVSALAASVADRLPEVSEYLEWEAERAEIVDPRQVPAKVVTMNSQVEILDLVGGARRVVTLVYPEHEDASAGRVSILSPLGAALIGVFEGFSIDYPTPGGRTGTVRVLKVRFQPEANGQYDG
jgi:regulator of nucleoside diphosphate kinase